MGRRFVSIIALAQGGLPSVLMTIVTLELIVQTEATVRKSQKFADYPCERAPRHWRSLRVAYGLPEPLPERQRGEEVVHLKAAHAEVGEHAVCYAAAI